MSRTDKTRPYNVRCEDPLEPTYWSSILNEWCLEPYIFSPYSRSTPDLRRILGHKPDRARTRLQVERIRQEFNAGEDVDDADVFSPQARHSVDWICG